ncbi:MAG TPA: MBL fold metallo-hydrolase [Thermodesulfobacteriota bacterium]|nr:MBL fold metallo-hydrolase [Thermodesulfobacteriota bacterium]
MRITTLIENKPSDTDTHLVSEWGLSLHIAFNGRSILFDTGLTGSFAKNAERLSVNLASVEAAVLSHHHFDHGGGLKKFLELNSNAKVHLGETPNGDCCARLFWFMKKYVGLEKALLKTCPDRFAIVRQPTQILPDVFIFPNILDTYPRPKGNKRLYLRKNGKMTPDNFSHEIVMAIKENGKLVVFTGCSHSGILNMLDTVAKNFVGVPIKAVIGGFHLVASPPSNAMAGSTREVEDLGRLVLNYPVDLAYTGHCTGTKAFGVLKSVMGERLGDIQTGTCFEV